MCGLLQCGPVFDPNGLITGGYLYNWLQTVLNSPKEKVRLVKVRGRQSFVTETALCVTLYNACVFLLSDPSAGPRYTCASAGEQCQHPVPTPLGNR